MRVAKSPAFPDIDDSSFSRQPTARKLASVGTMDVKDQSRNIQATGNEVVAFNISQDEKLNREHDSSARHAVHPKMQFVPAVKGRDSSINSITKRVSKRSVNDDTYVSKNRNVNAAATDDDGNEPVGDEDHHHERDAPDAFNDVLYLGSAASLYQTVSLSEFTPRLSLLPLTLVDSSLKLCDYFIKFSGALALLNMVPCIHLDGQHITEAVIEWSLSSRVSAPARGALYACVTACGTILLLSNVIVGIVLLIWP